jgi:SEC-C motif-containing protein
MFEKCPCGSGKLYGNCCKPYIKGKENAPTPEALMRSRYTAYVLHEIDFIINTCTEGGNIDRKSVEDWSNKSKWFGLEIISSDETGTVEFKAAYEQGNLKKVHHEIAYFRKYDNDRWLYDSGKIIIVPVTRSETKQGRNEYCMCGSGKKYKHCCGM